MDLAHFWNTSGAYEIDQSLRFNSADSAYLNRTPASAGNRKTWTWSGWVKRSTLGTQQPLFNAGIISNQQIAFLAFSSTGGVYDKLELHAGVGGVSTEAWTQSLAFYRDPSAWYHVVVAVDTTQSTAADRVKFYVNNSSLSVAGYSSYNAYPSQNYSYAVNNTVAHEIGKDTAAFGVHFGGYLAEVNFIDGQALTPSSFGETDTITGAWIPKKYSGSYGTNGFYLNFSDNSGTTSTTLGKDSSGNSNNWTPNNFSVTAGAGNDVLSDSPTNNWCTLNPLEKGSTVTLSNGNLDYSFGASSQRVHGTVGISSGKWYWEETKNSGTYGAVGISLNVAPTTFTGNDAYSWSYNKNGNKYHNGTGAAYGATWDSGDTIGIAFDADAGSLEFYKNGTSQGTAYSNIPIGNTYFPACGDWGVNGTVNFGQRSFSYTPPTGYKALNTANLPEPTIKKGGAHFNTVTFSGNGSAGSVSGVGFQPDFIWAKNRTSAFNHELWDAVRGVNSTLFSNQTYAEDTTSNRLVSFDTDGFSYGTSSNIYVNSTNSVAWNWKANGAGSSNTAGTITSTVSANPTAGFSIVTWTGNATNGSVGHGLGVAPKLLIVKDTDNAYNWYVFTTATGTNLRFEGLNTTSAATTQASQFTASSTTISNLTTSASLNTNGATMLMYCFSEVAGYSKFGSYTGNGSSDGPFVFCGFRPALVIWKQATGASDRHWVIRDSVRDPDNPLQQTLYPSTSGSEQTLTAQDVDFLSNGFKIKTNWDYLNASGETYIFAAFAEHPFKYANAR